MDNFYAKAIDILLNDSIDFRQVMIDLAKSNPQKFCEIVDATTVEPQQVKNSAWMRAVKSNLIAGMKVDAIKQIRSETGFGLKEAKDVSDHLINSLMNRGFTLRGIGYCHSADLLNREQQQVLDNILEA